MGQSHSANSDTFAFYTTRYFRILYQIQAKTRTKSGKIDALCTKINPKHVQKAENAKNVIVRKL